MPGKYPAAARAAALKALLEDHASLADAAAIVADLTGHRPARATIATWARAAGLDLADLAQQRDPAKQTAAARAAKAAQDSANRLELVDLLRDGISLAAARLIADRLQRALADEEVVAAARQRWADAVALEAHASDHGPDELAQARQATRHAKADLLVAAAGALDTSDLSLMLNRSVRAYLAVVTNDADAGSGEVAVTFTAPRPSRQPLTVVHLTPEDAHR